MKKNIKIKEKLIMIAGGMLTGAANGFFGGGGGMLCVPLLEKGLKMETKISHATAILIILPTSLASAITYLAGGVFLFLPTVIVSVGVVLGGIVGALLLKALNPKITALLFSIIMIVAGIKLAV